MNISNNYMDAINSDTQQCTIATFDALPQRGSNITVTSPDGRSEAVKVLSAIAGKGHESCGFIVLGHPKIGSYQPPMQSNGMDKPWLEPRHAKMALHAFSC